MIKKAESIEEKKMIGKLGRTCFPVTFRFFVPAEPEWAYYTEDENGNIAGGIILKKLNDSTGIIDWIFVGKNGRGKGIGKELLSTGLQAMKDAGLTHQAALVRDDNTASWNLFAKEGFNILPMCKWISELRAGGFFYVLFTMFASTGYSVWSSSPKAKQTSSIFQLCKGLLINSILILIISLIHYDFLSRILPIWGAAALIMALRTLFSYMGTLKMKTGRSFRTGQGGLLISLLQSFFGIWWPIPGQWLPADRLWKEPEHRKSIGLSSLLGWCSVMGTLAASFFIPGVFGRTVRIFATMFLILESIPIFPCEGFSGFRVLRWSKAAYLIALAVSVILLVISFSGISII